MENPSEIKIAVFGKTDVGLIREHNEDTFLVTDVGRGLRSSPDEALEIALSPKGSLFLVCDGMGGAAAGEVASTMAVESISATMEAADALSRDAFARRLRESIEIANSAIFAQSRDNQNERGMGTTCTAAALVDSTLIVAQIGDSRCYVLRGGQLTQVTKDQSLAWQLIEAGALTAEEAKSFEHANIILQALGVQDRVDVVLSQVPLRRGDTILVSSDGLHGPVSDEEMKQILAEEPDVKKACEQLVARANEHEGPDNITVVVAHCDGPGLPEATPEDVVAFVPYDPGSSSEPEPAVRNLVADKVTAEVAVPTALAAAFESERTSPPPAAPVIADTAAPAPAHPSPARPAPAHPSEARPILTFMLLTLVAALAGAVFLIFQRAHLPERGLVDGVAFGGRIHNAPAVAAEPAEGPSSASRDAAGPP